MTDTMPGGKAAEASSSTKLKYVHEPLDRDKTAFRLVKILPREGLEHVRCEVMNTDLDLAPKYKALSYVWGPRSPAQNIDVNGSYLSVRQNLWEFLDIISKEPDSDPQCYYFIDQLCIDQENVVERNHQVYQMAQIYRNAEEVIIWIKARVTVSQDWFQHPNLEDPRIDISRQERLRELATDDYWSRLWVLQEVVLAKTVVLKWGSAVCTFVRVNWLCRNQLGLGGGQNLGMTDLSSLRLRFLLEQKISWFALAKLADNKSCEDPRDQIYALLGLVGDTKLWPDYTKSVEEVFQDWVRKALSKEKGVSKGELRGCFATWRKRMNLPPEKVPEELMRDAPHRVW